MLKRIFISLAIFFCLLFQTKAQLLTIGDTFSVEPLTISGKKIALSQLKKKLIILDFWSQNCTGCIASFPKIETLQKEFDSTIQIILVNRESEKSTTEFFLKRKKIIKPGVLYISGDTLLNKLFSHDAEPYHVWLDSALTIRFMTDGHTTTAKNIREFLNGTSFKARHVTKTRVYVPSLFDSSKIKDLSYASYLSRCRLDYHLSSFNRKDFAELTQSCVSIEELYQLAFNESEKTHFGYSRPGRTILKVRDSLKVRRQKDPNLYTEWLDNYSFNYQLIIPKESDADKYRMLREDLERNFKLHAYVELRTIRCLVLVRTSTINKLKTKGNKAKFNLYRTNGTTTKPEAIRELINVPSQTLSTLLQDFIEKAHFIPFVDATHLSGNIDIQISGEAMDSMSIIQLKKEFEKFDLDLIEMDLPMKVLVISDDKNRPSNAMK